MDTTTTVLEAETIEAPTCQHQWMIEMPAGPSSKGVCRLCGDEKQFMNYIEGSSWGYDVSLDQLSGGSRLPSSPVDAKKGLAEDE